jgi:integrase
MTKPMKRPNNAGSVYKLSGRRRKPWAASITLGYDKDGKRRRRVTTHATKKEALQELTLYDIAPTERPNIKLKELYDEWSAAKYKKITPATADNYKAAYLKLSPLQNKKFNDLRTAHYQAIIDGLELSHSSLQKVRTLVSMLYSYAMQMDICNKNYADFIELPTETKAEKENFTRLEIQKLIKHDSDHVTKIILIMIFLGFRVSAALQLTRFNYDIENQIIRGGSKTEAGINRPVPVHKAIRKYLEYFVSLNGETLLCKPDGGAYTADNFRKAFYYDALKAAGVRKLTPHKCRHTLESLMINSGCNDTAILKTMGHKDFAFSVTTYGHAEYEFLHDEINKIDIGG